MLIKSDCIKKVFYKLLNKDNYNLLLVDRTGLIIGMLRKIQKWNLSSIINEYRLYTGKNRSYFSETFLELISIKLTQESSTGRETLQSQMRRLETLSSHSGRTEIRVHQKLDEIGMIVIMIMIIITMPIGKIIW